MKKFLLKIAALPYGDKLIHFTGGAIVGLLGFVIALIWTVPLSAFNIAVVVGAVIGVLKEFVDSFTHKPDIWDAVTTALGAVVIVGPIAYAWH